MSESAAPDQPWAPLPPEMCGQCGAGGFNETWRSGGGPEDVLVEFTCPGCGYIVSKYAHFPEVGPSE